MWPYKSQATSTLKNEFLCIIVILICIYEEPVFIFSVSLLTEVIEYSVLCFLRGSAGYCFVEMADEASVDRCVQRLNGKLVPGSNPV